MAFDVVRSIGQEVMDDWAGTSDLDEHAVRRGDDRSSFGGGL
jgi:hypothetical protein